MVASALALSLIGLGAVQALPAGRQVEERQIWIGDGSGVFIPGNGELPPCLVDGTPLNEQPPCVLPPIVGDLGPSTRKRQVRQRDVVVGDPKTVILPGPGQPPVCIPTISLIEQPPCILPPIVGPFKPSTKRGEPEKRQVVIGDPSGVFIPGPGELPVCLTDTPLNQQPPCLLPPIVGGLDPSTRKREIEKRQTLIGGGSGVFIPGPGQVPPCLTGIPLTEQPPCLLPPIVGPIRPSSKQKRAFLLPPDYATNTKEVIKALQKQLVALQNKKNKTKEDLKDIDALKAALKYLAGITNISAPPGSGTVFIPGKRDAQFDLDTVGTYADVCPNLVGAQIALQKLMHKDKPTQQERIIMRQLAAFLKGCGIVIVKSPDGTFTTIKPADKRESAAQLDFTGLQVAYHILLAAATEIYPQQPSFTNWLAMKQIEDVLTLSGASLEVDSARQPKIKQRQTNIISVGAQTCNVADVMGLRAALAALLTAYGEPSKTPLNIFLIEQVIVTALQLCGQSVPGWTTIIPGSPIPGGPMVPQPTVPGAPLVPDTASPGGPLVPNPTVPGAPLVPDPTVPGGDIKPADKKRQAPVGDPAAMLAALKTLEEAYGAYGSGKIPAPVFLIMVNIVTILQGIPGVVVPGWPILGQGSVVIGPAN